MDNQAKLTEKQDDSAVLNVLVVDDESVSRQMVRRLLSDAGRNARIEEVETAAEAIRVLSDSQFDVAILDHRLPDGNALTVLRSLRKYGRLRTPIIVFTAHGNKNAADDAIHEGAQDYLPKDGITADNLDRAIRYSIQRHRLWHDLQWSRERERREKELRLLQQSVTASGADPDALKEMPEVFSRFVAKYEQLMTKLLDEAMFKTTIESGDLAKAFASELGELHAGPKDVIEIHTAAVKHAVENASKAKEQAITEEARILLVQVMGFLVMHYRSAHYDRSKKP